MTKLLLTVLLLGIVGCAGVGPGLHGFANSYRGNPQMYHPTNCTTSYMGSQAYTHCY